MLKTRKKADIYKLLAILIILAGAIWRIIIWWQNRNLILDEANITRNLFERGFAGLVKPLSYEQYAPPIFLWIEKLMASLFGFGERVLRFYPLLTGLGALVALYGALKKLVTNQLAIFYPLILFATAHIFIRYSSEVKQYMPDVFIVLSLLWLALSTDIKKYTPGRFFLLWAVVGSIAVWTSMPSVFMLAGIGCYYGWAAFSDGNYTRLLRTMLFSAVWVVQFAIYYLLILKPQANSAYLQNFHQNDFLFATPGNGGEWMHNWVVFNALLKNVEGQWPMVLTINTVFLLAGIVFLILKNRARALLLLVPIGGLLLAAALNQYSLMPRVALFSMPLLFLIIACGIDAAAKIEDRIWHLAVAAMLLLSVASSLDQTKSKPWKYEQLTDGLDFLKKEGLPRGHLYVYHSSGPALVYYTTIHPQRNKWADFKDADMLEWSTLYDSLAWQMMHVWKAKTFGFVFTNATEEQLRVRVGGIKNYLHEKKRYTTDAVSAYIFTK
jgi:hypothetical protein